MRGALARCILLCHAMPLFLYKCTRSQPILFAVFTIFQTKITANQPANSNPTECSAYLCAVIITYACVLGYTRFTQCEFCLHFGFANGYLNSKHLPNTIFFAWDDVAFHRTTNTYSKYINVSTKIVVCKFTEFDSLSRSQQIQIQIPHVKYLLKHKTQIHLYTHNKWLLFEKWLRLAVSSSKGMPHSKCLLEKAFPLQFTHFGFLLYSANNISFYLKWLVSQWKSIFRMDGHTNVSISFADRLNIICGQHKIAILWTEWHDICIIKTIKIHAYCFECWWWPIVEHAFA